MNDYERKRAERVARNKEALKQLVTAPLDLTVPAPVRAPRAPRTFSVRVPVEPRRSARSDGKVVSYTFDDEAGERRPRTAGAPRFARRRLTLEELEALSPEEKAQLEAAAEGGIDSGRGRRVQGGRIYDSTTGLTCHWCRQKTVEFKVKCTSPLCKGVGKPKSGEKLLGRMVLAFCGACLDNRHGEDVILCNASGDWLCPRCRGGCGPSCPECPPPAGKESCGCCNCGPCRKKQGLASTGSLKWNAVGAGYTNAHDFLCGRALGLADGPPNSIGPGQAAMDARRAAKGWSKWVARLAGPAAAAGAAGGAGGAGAAGCATPASTPVPADTDATPTRTDALPRAFKAVRAGEKRESIAAAASPAKRGRSAAAK